MSADIGQTQELVRLIRSVTDETGGHIKRRCGSDFAALNAEALRLVMAGRLDAHLYNQARLRGTMKDRRTKRRSVRR